MLLCRHARRAQSRARNIADAFDAIYPTNSPKKHGVVFYPFFLDGVAAQAKLAQRDGMHPNAAGVDTIVASILPKVEELIARCAPGAGS